MEDLEVNILEDFLYPAIEEINELIGLTNNPLKKSPDTILFGSGSPLDSIGLVSFVVAVEDRIEDRTQKRIALATEKAMSKKTSPFRTIDALAEYIHERLQENQGAADLV